jgi:hypothetical protein
MIEAALIISGVGIVLAVFIPVFVRELRVSKTSEAAEHLELLYQRSAAYFAARRPRDGSIALRECLPEIAGPTPRAPSAEPREVNFRARDLPGGETWRALDFNARYPIRYSYTFEPTASGCGLRSPESTYLLTIRAEGDLDSDGERSIFERRARANERGELEPSGILFVRDRVE